MGYMRYFHPADTAFSADWERIGAAHITRVEQAQTPQQLQRLLSEIFTPYAPTLQLYLEGENPALPRTLSLQLRIRPLYIIMNVRIVVGENDTLQLLRGDRVSVKVETPPWPGQFLYPSAGLNLRFPQPPQLEVIDPAQPLRTHLGGGVWAAIPLAVYSTATGTLPRVRVPAEPQLLPNQFLRFTSALQFRSSRLSMVAQTWALYRHLYAYWDEVDTDWEAVLEPTLAQAAQATSEAEFLAVVQRMTAQLQDGHHYLEQAGRSQYGSHTLPLTHDWVAGQLLVTTLTDSNLGLQLGDAVVAINGQPVRAVLQPLEDRIAGSAQYKRYLSLAWLMGGGPQTSLELEVSRVGSSQNLKVTVPRSVAKPRSLPDHLRENRPAPLSWLTPNTLYLDLTRLTERQFQPVLDQLSRAEFAILDLRGYPDNLAVQILSHFTDQPLEGPPFALPIVTRPNGQQLNYVNLRNVWAQPEPPRLSTRLAFLINANGNISFAESVGAMVERYRLGLLVGQPTAGANGNTVTFILPHGYVTRWTGMKVHQNDGSPLMAVGIQPTLPVERTLPGVAAGRDEVLEAAFRALTGREAAEIRPRPVELR